MATALQIQQIDSYPVRNKRSQSQAEISFQAPTSVQRKKIICKIV
jgi:hypothetical protein